jgi:hypothetical protein
MGRVLGRLTARHRQGRGTKDGRRTQSRILGGEREERYAQLPAHLYHPPVRDMGGGGSLPSAAHGTRADVSSHSLSPDHNVNELFDRVAAALFEQSILKAEAKKNPSISLPSSSGSRVDSAISDRYVGTRKGTGGGAQASGRALGAS